jgi:hypothetical protein
VNAADGKPLWRVPTGAAVWNAPAVHEGTVLVGSRDGKLYAIDAPTGTVKWTAATGGPLLSSPAVDPQARAGGPRVYVGSEDMRVYAFDLRDGRELWRSAKLPGVSLRGYHPVIAPDGSVLVTVAPALSVDTFQTVLLDLVKEVFGDFASWRHTKEENARLREANFRLMEKPETYTHQLNYLRRRLAEQPAYQTFFVLDPSTGRQKFVTPIVYAESMNGPGAPPLVTSDGKVIVKYQALLRSRYEHYSPFLNVGYLDTVTGHITPIMDASRTYGWHDSLLLVHDEQCQLSLAGRVLINTHQDNVNALDLDTLQGYAEPFCRNIHEPQPGEAVGLWTHVLRGQPLPVGKEWLARGTAVYGGGSVLDVPVAVAGDRFYFLPTHEINAGVALIACRMKPGGTAGRSVSPPKGRLTDREWQQVQQMPWDWDTLEMPRLNHVLAALPGKVPGTRPQPLTNEAAQAVAQIADAALDRIIWEARLVPSGGDTLHEPRSSGRQPAPSSRQRDQSRLTSAATRVQESDARAGSGNSLLGVPDLRAKLVSVVQELITNDWRPLLFPSGKHPEEAYRFFNEPTETLYTLALAFPHLDGAQQQAVRERVSRLALPGAPLDGPTGQRTYQPGAGAVRSAYEHPPERLLRIDDGLLRSEVARLYPLWLWAHTAGDWRKIEDDWPNLRKLLQQAPHRMEDDSRNGYLAGLIAYCRVARQLQDEPAVNEGVAAVRQAMRERLAFELAHTRGGLIWPVRTGRSIFARWHHLTPEVGRLLALHARPVHQHLMEVYVDYHRPTWWLAWNVETMMRNEAPYQFPIIPAEIFAARALILGEPSARLAAFLDLPWCRADEFYAQKLALALDAAGVIRWEDLRRAN